MFAIRLSEANLQKIGECHGMTEKDRLALTLFVEDPRALDKWVILRGLVVERGSISPWTLYPARRFKDRFDHNWEKMEHDWDVVVKRRYSNLLASGSD